MYLIKDIIILNVKEEFILNLKNIGENIKKIRTKKGITQAQLAEKANISNVHMSHIETGSVAMSLDCLINISNSLNTTPDNILIGEYKITPSSSSVLIEQHLKNLTSDENRLIIEIAKLIDEVKVNR